MKFNYDDLWKLLIDRKMTKTQLRHAAGISTATLAKMSKGDAVGPRVIEKVCAALDCGIRDILDSIPDGEVAADKTMQSTK